MYFRKIRTFQNRKVPDTAVIHSLVVRIKYNL